MELAEGVHPDSNRRCRPNDGDLARVMRAKLEVSDSTDRGEAAAHYRLCCKTLLVGNADQSRTAARGRVDSPSVTARLSRRPVKAKGVR